MVSNINEALMNYIKQPLLPNKNKLIEFLWVEIIDALKGRKGCTKFEHTYKFHYKYKITPEIQNNSLPDEVELFGIKKDFNEALEELRKEDVVPDCFCCIYATAIFITPQDIMDSFKLLSESSIANVVMGVSKYNLQPVQALEKKEDGLLKPMWPEYVNVQSQFHPYLVVSNGTLYWARTERFLKTGTFYDDTLMGYEIPWVRALDIDTKESLEIVKMLAPSLLE